jgi:hypothetical protein
MIGVVMSLKVAISAGCVLLATAILSAVSLADDSVPKADQTAADKLAADKEALGVLQVCIGSWKGVGQPKRGSTDGAWVENADWAWKFDNDRASIVLQLTEGKFFARARVVVAAEGQLRLVGMHPDGKTETTYSGKVASEDDGLPVVIFTAERPAEGVPARITLRMVAQGDRLLLLLEKRIGSSDRFLRIAEVGYTRKGSDFGKGTTQRECVVTGGAGTIPVMHKGQTYYVCCTGCKDLFDTDPEKIIAEYAQRKKAEKEKRLREK